MRKKSVMTSSYAYPSACTDRAGKDQVDSAREGTGNPRNAACVCLGETKTSQPRGSQCSVSSKDIEFRLFDDKQLETLTNMVLRLCL